MNEVIKLGMQPEESAEEAESMKSEPNQNPSRVIKIDGDESMEQGYEDEEIAEDCSEANVDGKEDTSDKISLESKDDEYDVPGATVVNDQHYVTRHGRVSKPCDHAKYFPETLQFAHYESETI